MGLPWAFIAACAVVLAWAASGPLFGFSNTWQLVINTATTIVTFLMVFLIQNTQNRDAKAIQLKLDELILGVKGARTGLVALEEMDDAALEELQEQFNHLREHHDVPSAAPQVEAVTREKTRRRGGKTRGRTVARNGRAAAR
jgi:low affinity Fe/Cu permease